MPLYEVKKGNIPVVPFGDKPAEGWLRVGPETEKLWSYPSERSTEFYHIGLFVVSSHVSREPAHEAHMHTLEGVDSGENPIEFHGIVPVDEHSFHDYAISGLLYRSGFYRGAVKIESVNSPKLISDRIDQYVQTYWHDFDERMAR